MSPPKKRDMLQELHQAVIGIPDNPDENGLIGDIKEISKKLDVMNGRVRKVEVRSKVNQAIVGLITGGSGVAAGITKLMDLW